MIDQPVWYEDELDAQEQFDDEGQFDDEDDSLPSDFRPHVEDPD